MMSIYRKRPGYFLKWNQGDIDVAFQLFANGMVWDGNLASKNSRDHLSQNGYLGRASGIQALSGRGVFAFLTHHQTWLRVLKNLRQWGSSGLTATPDQIKRAMQ